MYRAKWRGTDVAVKILRNGPEVHFGESYGNACVNMCVWGGSCGGLQGGRCLEFMCLGFRYLG